MTDNLECIEKMVRSKMPMVYCAHLRRLSASKEIPALTYVPLKSLSMNFQENKGVIDFGTENFNLGPVAESCTIQQRCNTSWKKSPMSVLSDVKLNSISHVYLKGAALHTVLMSYKQQAYFKGIRHGLRRI